MACLTVFKCGSSRANIQFCSEADAIYQNMSGTNSSRFILFNADLSRITTSANYVFPRLGARSEVNRCLTLQFVLFIRRYRITANSNGLGEGVAWGLSVRYTHPAAKGPRATSDPVRFPDIVDSIRPPGRGFSLIGVPRKFSGVRRSRATYKKGRKERALWVGRQIRLHHFNKVFRRAV